MEQVYRFGWIACVCATANRSHPAALKVASPRGMGAAEIRHDELAANEQNALIPLQGK